MPTSSSLTRFIDKLARRVRPRFAHPLFFVRISGESMWPTLVPGRRYLATSLLRPRVGRIVVAQHPYESRFIVKKIDKITADRLHLVGLVSWSDSYTLGSDALIGVVVTTRWRR